MKRKNASVTRMTAALLVAAILVGVCSGLSVMSAADNFSLTYIETIKAEKQSKGDAFIITEIAPNAESGVMGYYVAGQEPFSTWKTSAAELNGNARRAYVSNLKNNLTQKGLLGDEGFPFKESSPYTEYYPWENAPENKEIYNLSNYDKVNVKGNLSYNSEGGDYDFEVNYRLPRTINLFDAEAWYSNLAEKHYNDSGTNNSSAFCTFSGGKITVDSLSGNSDVYTNHAWKYDDSFYLIDVKPNTEYKFTYTVENQTGTGGGSQIYIFGYGAPGTYAADYCSYLANDYRYQQSGTFSVSFNTGNTDEYLGIRFGTFNAVPHKAVFSNPELIEIGGETETPQYVQDVLYYTKEEEETIYSENLFNTGSFYNAFVNKGSKMSRTNTSFDVDNGTFIVNTVQDTSGVANPYDCYTCSYSGGSSDNGGYYSIPVTPGEKYIFTCDTATEGNVRGQVYLFTVDQNYNIHYNADGNYFKYSIVKNGQSRIEVVPEDGVAYIQFRFGTTLYSPTLPGTGTVNFSNISVVQEIHKSSYYYDLDFTLIPAYSSIRNDTAVYTKNENGDYEYYGTVYEDGTGAVLASGVQYYKATVKPNTVPQGRNNAENTLYRAVSDNFVLAENGERAFFVSTEGEGYYVGNKQGSFDLTIDENGHDMIINTKTVYHTGDFINNDWFRYKVLECDTEDFPIAVITCSPKDYDTLSTYIPRSDLIVISNGFSIYNGSAVNFDGDISEEVANLIKEANENEVAIAIDAIVKSKAGDNLKSLITDIEENTGDAGVYNNVFAFKPVEFEAFYFSTNRFYSKILSSSLYLAEGTPYHQVYYEIGQENTIRNVKRLPLLEQSGVSEATCFRHILNYKGQRVLTKKESIKILDIEPYSSQNGKCVNASGSEVTYDKNTNTVSGNVITTKSLSKEEVLSWLPANSYTEDDIEIVTMAAGELIGKNESIIENYDLVYIGASLANMYSKVIQDSLSEENGFIVPDYNDNNMDGMYYTNTGDTVVTGDDGILERPTLAGLLRQDYSVALGEFWWVKPGTSTMRSSGNDITEEKLRELVEFADAGMPVIVGDSLTKIAYDETYTAKADGILTAGNPFKAKLTASTDKPLPPTVITYQWIRIDSNGNRVVCYEGTSDTYEFNIPLKNTTLIGDYYCNIKFTYNGVSCTLQSNTVTISNNKEYTFAVWMSKIKVGKDDAYQINFDPYPPCNLIEYRWKYRKGLIIHSWEWGNGTNETTYTTQNYYVKGTARAYIRIDGVDLLQMKKEGGEWTDSIFSTNDLNDRFIYTLTFYGLTKNNNYNPTPFHSRSTLNPDRVDNCSYMWQFLQCFNSLDNVMSSADASKSVNDIAVYLNMTAPELNIAESTKQYPESISNKTLEITFSVYNQTEPNPERARYEPRLFIDTDGDGKFSANEQEDIACDSIKVSQNKASPEHVYKISRTLPESYVGIIPWRLEVQNTTDSNSHASYEGFSYVTPDADSATTIKAIMVLPGDWDHEYKPVDSNRYSENLYMGCVFESEIFDALEGFNRQPGYWGEDDLYHVPFKIRNDFIVDIACWNVYNMNQWYKNPDNYDKLSKYNMLILGFGDSYGKLGLGKKALLGTTVVTEGFNAYSSLAIDKFIKSNKAVLFCHDTTTNCTNMVNYITNDMASKLASAVDTVANWFLDLFGFDNEDKYKYEIEESRTKQGYYNNLFLRDTLGMDRYGITKSIVTKANANYGISGITLENSKQVNLTRWLKEGHADTYIYGNQCSIKDMESSGHSIAWTPGTAQVDEQDVPVLDSDGYINGSYDRYTQGFTSYTLNRYAYEYRNQKLPLSTMVRNTDNSTTKTNKITQVNKGKITTYPYDINTEELNETLSVGQTHEQYYQLNMNNDDITVWYCLAGNDYSIYRNDCYDAYYVYSKGNVTYTGAGHTNTFTSEEAKLFVNTLIAAYRTNLVEPAISFRDKADTIDEHYDVYVVDEIVNDDESVEYSVDDKTLYFKAFDKNLGTKTITADIYYLNSSGEAVDITNSVEIKDKNGNVVAKNALVSGEQYNFAIPDELKEHLAQNDISSCEIFVHIEVVLDSNPAEPAEGTGKIELRKYQMFEIT